MKIIHPSGECYDLKPDTALDMTRKNPFFNEYGEQSLPITLPATEKNRRLTGYPDDLANISKHTTRRLDATIQSGIFSIKSRQAILSGQRKEGIQTSFYLNEGAFYEKYKDLQLSEVFKDKVITFPSVPDAITFVRNLMVTYDERFACFPVMVITDEADTRVGYINEIDYSKTTDGYYHLYNEEARSETIGENTISLSPGFYISPFIRGNHLLKEIFSYLGYTLNDNFFSRTAPFRDMVFLNNNIDTIVKSEIRYTQIIPDAMVSTILNVYRNRFCCEFIPNESNKTIDIVLFNEVINAPTTRDITPTLISEPQISYPKTFRQVQLSAEKMSTIIKKDNYTRGESLYQTAEYNFNSLKDLVDKYPDVKLNKISGKLTRTGYQGHIEVTETIGLINCNYYAGGNLETEKKESPDLFIDMIYKESSRGSTYLYPFIGPARAINSTIVLNNTPSDSEATSDSKTTDKKEQELKPMICFVHHKPERMYDIGTIYNYDETGLRLWDYTLSFNGPDGLFEKFYRQYDNLLRNSLLDVSVQQLLTEEQKLSLSSYRKVILKNQELLPNEIKYSPGLRQPAECTYFTTKLYEPVSQALPESERIPPESEYYWSVLMTQSHSGYRYRTYKEKPPVIYLTPPTPQQYAAGGKYHQKTYDVLYSNRYSEGSLVDPVPGTITVWFEPRKR